MSTENALSEIENMSSVFAKESFSLAQIFSSCALAIALVFVLYEVANKKPHAREYVIAWLIAVILYVIFLSEN